MTHEEIDRKYGPNGEDLDRDVLLHMHRTAQKFVEGNIVHVEGFTSRTSTGEVTGVDPGNPNFGETGFYCTVDFPDGEHQTFHEDELRFATDAERVLFLTGLTAYELNKQERTTN